MQAGQSIPFITGTLSISILLDNQTILLNAPVTTSKSYEIQIATDNTIRTGSIKTRSTQVQTESTSALQATSSALGVIRFIGGSTVTEPRLSIVNLYGKNAKLFAEFLYVNLYAQAITDSQARTATTSSVNTILNLYGFDYRYQQPFNYISYLYLINDQLLAAQAVLIADFPNSEQQITRFFNYLQKRASILLK